MTQDMEAERKRRLSMKLLVFSVFCLLGPDIFFCSGGGCGRSGYGHCLFAREPFWISVEAHKPAFSRLFLLPSSFFLSPANSSRKNLGKSALRSSCRASPALSPSGQATRPACRTRRKSSLTLFLPCLPLKLVSPSSSPYSSLSVPPSFSAAYLSRSVSPPSPSLLLSSSSSSAGIRFPSSSSSSPPFASTSYSSPPSLCALSLPCSSSSSSSPLREVFLQTASTFLHAPLLSPPAGDVPPHPPSRLLLLSHSSLGYSHEGEHSISGEDGKPDPTRQRVKDFVSSAPVVLFMKGTPEFPQCGFSRAIVQLLELVAEDIKRPDTTQPAARNDASVDSDASFFLLSKGLPRDFFRCLNVLEDSEMREGVKRYTSWPTIPQLFISQTFLGGLDVATEMFKDRSLHKEMEKALQEHYRRTESSSEVSSVEDAQ